MKKRIYNYLLGIVIGSAGFGLLMPYTALAADDDCKVGPIILEVPFGNYFSSKGLTEYLALMYQFIVYATIIAAVVMIMFAGLKWAAAAGNSSMVSDSKERIKNAMLGVGLALASFTVLSAINPNLVIFPEICPKGLEFDQRHITDWVECADGNATSCSDVSYCNYSDTVENECSCENIGSQEGAYYVCRPNKNGIVPVGGICQEDSNCVDVPDIKCVGNSGNESGICTASTEGKECESDSECTPDQESCVQGYTDSITGRVPDSSKTCMSISDREDGSFCENDSECSSNVCYRISGSSVAQCQSGEEGGICGTDDDCQTGYRCDTNICQARATGDSCDTDEQCQNATYPDNSCEHEWTNSCTDGSEGSECDDASDCSSSASYCVTHYTGGVGTNKCTDGDSGKACNTNDDCKSSSSCSDAGWRSNGTCD